MKKLLAFLGVLFLCGNAWGIQLIGNTFTFDSNTFTVYDRSIGGVYDENPDTLFTGEYIGTIGLNSSRDLIEYLVSEYLDDPSYSIINYDTVEVNDENNAGSGIDGNLTVNWNAGAMTGTWSTSPSYTSFYSVKGSNEFALYCVDPAQENGIWSTIHLLNGGGNQPAISHFDAVSTTVAPVPEPATMFLSGLGLISMAAYLRKRKNGKENV